MGEILDFPGRNITWRVSFQLPGDRPFNLNTTAEFPISIHQGQGVAFIPATSRKLATNKLLELFPYANLDHTL